MNIGKAAFVIPAKTGIQNIYLRLHNSEPTFVPGEDVGAGFQPAVLT